MSDQACKHRDIKKKRLTSFVAHVGVRHIESPISNASLQRIYEDVVGGLQIKLISQDVSRRWFLFSNELIGKRT